MSEQEKKFREHFRAREESYVKMGTVDSEEDSE